MSRGERQQQLDTTAATIRATGAQRIRANQEARSLLENEAAAATVEAAVAAAETLRRQVKQSVRVEALQQQLTAEKQGLADIRDNAAARSGRFQEAQEKKSRLSEALDTDDRRSDVVPRPRSPRSPRPRGRILPAPLASTSTGEEDWLNTGGSIGAPGGDIGAADVGAGNVGNRNRRAYPPHTLRMTMFLEVAQAAPLAGTLYSEVTRTPKHVPQPQWLCDVTGPADS